MTQLKDKDRPCWIRPYYGMGDDIKAVLSGENTVEIPKMEKKKFKVKLFF